MATTLNPVNVIALGSQIAAKRKSSCTKNTSFFTINPTKTRTGRPVFTNPNLVGAPFPVLRASSGPNPTEPTPQEDSQYVLKLVIGSVLGAALIKYGSILIPDITRPSLTQALLMISAPVVIAVLLLLKESSKE